MLFGTCLRNFRGRHSQDNLFWACFAGAKHETGPAFSTSHLPGKPDLSCQKWSGSTLWADNPGKNTAKAAGVARDCSAGVEQAPRGVFGVSVGDLLWPLGVRSVPSGIKCCVNRISSRENQIKIKSCWSGRGWAHVCCSMMGAARLCLPRSSAHTCREQQNTRARFGAFRLTSHG